MNGLMDAIITDVNAGKPIIIVDDYGRENEGDLCIAAVEANRQNLAFMINEGGGLMCVPCTGDRLDRLKIPMMVDQSTDKMGTPFTVSVDAMKKTTSGMSVDDRLETLRVLTNMVAIPSDLSRPGHMFPLRAHDSLLKGRRGHTESSVELMILAGVPAVSVIVEIMNVHGDMMRGQELENFAKYHHLNIISVEDIYSYVYNRKA